MFGAEIALAYALQNAASTPEQRHAWMMERIRDKETNMRNRLERRRASIQTKWLSRSVAAFALLFAIPLAIAALNWCWSLVLG